MKQFKYYGLLVILLTPLLSMSQKKDRNEVDSAISNFFLKTYSDMRINEKALLNTSNYTLYREAGIVADPILNAMFLIF